MISKLKAIRKIHGFTQDEVAKSLGVSVCAVSHLESGKRKFYVDELFTLARFYNVNVTDLYKVVA